MTAGRSVSSDWQNLVDMLHTADVPYESEGPGVGGVRTVSFETRIASPAGEGYYTGVATTFVFWADGRLQDIRSEEQ